MTRFSTPSILAASLISPATQAVPMLVNDPDAVHYDIDPARIDLAEEFRRNPNGPHSDELQKVLHRMRWSGVTGRWVLIALEPNRRWMLGRLPGARGTPIETFPNRIFTRTEDAEWEIFRLRWEALSGSSLPEKSPIDKTPPG